MAGDRQPEDASDDADAGTSRMGPKPRLEGAASIRSAVSAALFGDDAPSASTDAGAVAAKNEGEDEEDRPQIADRAKRRARIAAALFGAEEGAAAKSESWELDTEAADDAPRSAVSMVEQIDEQVGRFRVLERLGRGGMGVVYSAYDPELDRKVAIKLLRADVSRGMSAKDAQARLLREAQAMARLNHPNVIVVHEVGTVGDRVFVAMEFVDGGTLRDWMKKRRLWREVLDTFVKAGLGLAAAHEGGLVHRDFKPDNVLLGSDGRVRVVDFGLARSLLDRTMEPTEAEPTRERPEVDTLNTPLTRTGAVMGTPAYMSPEQHLGHPADARSDQFSFCVALYEALYGERPFQGRDLVTLSTNVVRGEMSDPPGDVRVPGWVYAAIRRGLSPKARDRFPSMAELLTELQRDPRKTWRRAGLGLGVAVIASAATYAVFGGGTREDACAGVGTEIDAVWNDDARQRLDAAIRSSGKPYAKQVAHTTVDLFDSYADKWRTVTKQACVAAQADSGQGQSLYEAKRQCLAARQSEVAELVEALAAGGEAMTQQAVPAVTDLSDLGECSDPKRVAAWAETSDPARREAMADARARLANAKAKGALGEYEAAIEIATGVVDDAVANQSPAVEASALLVRGQYRERIGDLAGAEADLDVAVARADAAGDFGTKAQALTRAVFVISREGDRYDEAKARGAEARGVLATLDAAPLLAADLEGALGAAARTSRRYDEALAHHHKALQIRERLLGPKHPDTASTLANIGSTLSAARRMQEAEPYLRRALESLEEVLGDSHPWVGTALGNLGNCLARQGKLEEALPLQKRSLEITIEALGPDNPSVALRRFNLGKLMTELGRHEDAEEILAQGLAQVIARSGESDEALTSWYMALGDNAEAQKKLDVARGYYQKGLDLRARSGSAAFTLAKFEFPIAKTWVEEDPVRAEREVQAAREHAVMWRDNAADADQVTAQNLVDAIDAWLRERSGEGTAPAP